MERIYRVVIAGLAAFATTVGGCLPGTDPASPSPTAPPAVVAPGSWQVESGVRVPQSSAPATLRLSDGTYRMYLPGLSMRTSPDGLSWSAPVKIPLSEPGEMLRNPAAIRLASDSYLMIYEGVKDERGPSRSTRFYRAVSKDGVGWTKTPGTGANGAVLEPAAGDGAFLSAPDILRAHDGTLVLYFNTSNGERVETATSDDEGRSWTREGPVTIAGFARNRKATDADVIALPGGGYRMFFGAGEVGAPNPRILSATSTDGQNFALDDGERLAGEAGALHRVDPDVVEIAPGQDRMYFAEAADGGGPYNLKSATLTVK